MGQNKIISWLLKGLVCIREKTQKRPVWRWWIFKTMVSCRQARPIEEQYWFCLLYGLVNHVAQRNCEAV